MSEQTLKLLTINDLSEVLGIPKATIYCWTSSNKIPHIKIGKHLKFILSDVLDYFKKQTKRGCPNDSIAINRKGRD